MKGWENIVKTAMLGTAKSAPDVQEWPDSIRDTIQSLPAETDAEDRFLNTASLLTVYKNAGTLLPETTYILPVAPPETMTEVPPEAGHLLKGLLNGSHPVLLETWLQLAVQKGLRAPHQLLPSILELAKTDFQNRASFLKIMGERGKWLAAMNPEWEFALKTSLQTWEEGKPSERMEVLKAVRAENPALAREWAAAGWKQETQNMKIAVLNILKINLSAEDEAFVKQALTDKNKPVKEKALELLCTMADSAWMLELWRETRDCISLKKTKGIFGSKEELEFTAPQYTDFLKGAGISQESPDKNFTDAEYQLYQVLQIIPPAFWLNKLECTADKLLQLWTKNKAAIKYMSALAVATVRHKDQAFAFTLLEYKTGADDKTLIPTQESFISLINLLTEPQKATLYQKKLLKKEFGFTFYILDYMQLMKPFYEVNFSRQVIKDLMEELNARLNDNTYIYNFRQNMDEALLFMHPSLLNEKDNLGTMEGSLKTTWDKAFDIVYKYHQIKRSFVTQ